MAARGRGLLGLPLGIVLQALNAVGDGLAMIALANRVFQTSHASWTVAAVFLAISVPITALAPVAGLLLDRLPPIGVLVAAAAAEAAIALALVWMTSLAATLALAVGFGVCAAILQPGLGAIVPRLAGRSGVTKANSYLQAATWVGFSVGPLLAGLLLAVSGSGLALAVNAGIYALSAVGLLALRLDPAPAATADGQPSAATFRSQISAGLRYLREDADAGLLVIIVAIMVAFADMAVVAEVVFAEQILHAGPTGYSLLVAGWTTGMVAGTLLGGRLPVRLLVAGSLVGTLLTGVGVVLAGLAPTIWLAVAAYAAGGLANGLETVATRSYIGHHAPAGVAGRVFAVYSGLMFGGMSAGMAVAAVVLTAIGARGLLVLSGAGGIVAGVVGCLIYAARRRRSPAAVTAERGIP
ncbi:MAG: MFS transporter [Actinomycetota bacterium]|nr:MFS transporter [Actinomycetota bacterium]